MRAAGKPLSVELFGDRLPPPAADARDSEYQKLVRCMRGAVNTELTPRQRECVELYYFDGHTLLQTAQMLGITEATASRHVKKARQRLSRALSYGFGRFVH